MWITIDDIQIQAEEGTTIKQGADRLGISIPTLCHLDGFDNHPSCMVCMVHEVNTGRYLPSCSYPVSEGMNIRTYSSEIREMRREALELLLSDHVGDCEAPCRLSCPAFMNIPLMNRHLAAGEFGKALSVVREEIAIPVILGTICPAPCEKACRRRPVDGAVSVCLLKRFAAQEGAGGDQDLMKDTRMSGKRVAVIGAGPAGLSAAFYLRKLGHHCTVFDRHGEPGGTLRYDIPREKLPQEYLNADIEVIRSMGTEFRLSHLVDRDFFEQNIVPEYDAVILATGNPAVCPSDPFSLEPDHSGLIVNRKTLATSRPGVFGCGSLLREENMAVRSAAQGKLAAIEADIYLKTHKPKRLRYKFHSAISHLNPGENEEYLKESIRVERREPVNGFLNGFRVKEAIVEAKRCLHCDCRKPVSCKLRQLSDEYHANRKRYIGAGRKSLTRNIQHDLVVYEPEKCIKCGLCVEITKKEGEAIGLTAVGRGFDVHIGIPFRESMGEALIKTAAACVEACPTGALAFKAD
jgi:NADPH-dependent glutamate synthase beta subunit-like oxidoreductase